MKFNYITLSILVALTVAVDANAMSRLRLYGLSRFLPSFSTASKSVLLNKYNTRNVAALSRNYSSWRSRTYTSFKNFSSRLFGSRVTPLVVGTGAIGTARSALITSDQSQESKEEEPKKESTFNLSPDPKQARDQIFEVYKEYQQSVREQNWIKAEMYLKKIKHYLKNFPDDITNDIEGLLLALLFDGPNKENLGDDHFRGKLFKKVLKYNEKYVPEDLQGLGGGYLPNACSSNRRNIAIELVNRGSPVTPLVISEAAIGCPECFYHFLCRGLINRNMIEESIKKIEEDIARLKRECGDSKSFFCTGDCKHYKEGRKALKLLKETRDELIAQEEKVIKERMKEKMEKAAEESKESD